MQCTFKTRISLVFAYQLTQLLKNYFHVVHPELGSRRVSGFPTADRLRASWLCWKHAGAAIANGGARRDRTADLLRARQALSQLSYSPKRVMVGLGGFEPPTSPLSGVRSNQLSYKP